MLLGHWEWMASSRGSTASLKTDICRNWPCARCPTDPPCVSPGGSPLRFARRQFGIMYFASILICEAFPELIQYASAKIAKNMKTTAGHRLSCTLRLDIFVAAPLKPKAFRMPCTVGELLTLHGMLGDTLLRRPSLSVKADGCRELLLVSCPPLACESPRETTMYEKIKFQVHFAGPKMVPQNSPYSSCKWLPRAQKWARLAGPFLGPQKSKIRPNLIKTHITEVLTYTDASWQLGRSRQWRCRKFYVLWLQKMSLQECHFAVSCGLAFSQLPPMSGTFWGIVVVPLWSRCGLVVVPPLYYNFPFKPLRLSKQPRPARLA